MPTLETLCALPCAPGCDRATLTVARDCALGAAVRAAFDAAAAARRAAPSWPATLPEEALAEAAGHLLNTRHRPEEGC